MIIFRDEQTYDLVDNLWWMNSETDEGFDEQEAINQQLFANLMGWA